MQFPDFAGLPHTPHGYQKAAFLNFVAEYDGQGRDQLIVMATGLGKSATAAMIARHLVEHRNRRVLVLANRDTLIGQLSEEFEYWGLANSIEKAESRALDLLRINSPLSRCVIGSVQTLRGNRLSAWPADAFDLVIQDECHYAPAATFRDIYRHFSAAKLLGLTATPARDDGKPLAEIFEHLAYEYLLPKAIADGELAKLSKVPVNVGIDLRDIKVVGRDGMNDLDAEAIGDAIGPMVEKIARAIILGSPEKPGCQLGPGQTLIFAPCRRSSQAIAAAFSDLGLPTASIDYKVADRQAIIRQFQEGTMTKHAKYAALSSYNMLTTGFNHKPVGNIIMLRPTTNHTLIEQMLGRGTRKCDLKSECKVFDFDWIIDPDMIAKPVDLFLPPGCSRLVRDQARSLADESPIDLAEAARLAVEAEASRQAREKAKSRGEDQVKVSVREKAPVKHKAGKPFDLFAVRSLTHRPVPAEREGVVRMPATAETMAKLRDLGFDVVAGMSQSVAESELHHWAERKACGMASLKQIRLLVRNGHDPAKAADLTIREAGQLVSQIQKRWDRAADRQLGSK